MLFTLKDLRTFNPQKWPFSRKKTATKWRMRKYTELPEDYLQTSWIVSVLIKIPCIYMILWLILPGKDIRHNQNNILQKFFVCNSKIEKTNLITSSSLLNSYTYYLIFSLNLDELALTFSLNSNILFCLLLIWFHHLTFFKTPFFQSDLLIYLS